MKTLVTVVFSHYCDKARWVLERSGVPYRESAWFPLLHGPAVLWHGGFGQADRASSPLSTPLLVGDGLYLRDSRAITRWADRTHGAGDLYDHPDVDRWEERLHDGLGVWTRALIYAHSLPDSDEEADDVLVGLDMPRWMAEQNVPPGQQRVVRWFGPALRSALTRGLGLAPERIPKWEKRVREELDRIHDEVGEGPLVDGRFTGADIALATMLSPLVVPAEYGAVLPPVERLTGRLAALVHEVRAHPVGQQALRWYREERRA